MLEGQMDHWADRRNGWFERKLTAEAAVFTHGSFNQGIGAAIPLTQST